jgi:RNA polymerase-binding protein DksA
MNVNELDRYRHTLIDLRRRIRGEVQYLSDEMLGTADEDAAGETADAPIRPTERGNHENEVRIGETLAGTEERLLEEIDAALERIASGAFGRCTTCGRAIGQERLRAVPYARKCIRCARHDEAVAVA